MVQVGEPWMPSFFSRLAQKTSFRAPGLPSPSTSNLRHQEERDAARSGRRIGKAREHQMHDVLGKVVLAVGDEDLLPEDAVGAVAAAFGPAGERAEVGARLRLRQVHGRRSIPPTPCAADRASSAHRCRAVRAPRSPRSSAAGRARRTCRRRSTSPPSRRRARAAAPAPRPIPVRRCRSSRRSASPRRRAASRSPS